MENIKETTKPSSWLYSDKVKDHFFNPRNIMKDEEDEYKADGIGYVGNPACGDMMKVWIKVDKENDKIIDCKWRTFGCASAIGSTSMLSEMVTKDGGMRLEDALKIQPKDILKELGGLPDRKIHCSVLGDKALRAAINNYFKKSDQANRITETIGKVVCECMGVTNKDIEEAVLEGATDFEKLQEQTKIATGCGKCKEEAMKFLEWYKKKYFEDS
ncbi:MAG: iron-sulfur cluster assembly scaffold protein [Pseudomonadota bacterium]